MRIRERGVAHVNIMFFLIMLVLFLGALFFAYSQMSENNSLNEQIKLANVEASKARYQVILRDDLLKDLVGIVGESGDYKGREGKDYKQIAEEAGMAEEPLKNVPVPAKIATVLAAFGKDLQVPESMKGLTDILNAAKATNDANQRKAADLELERSKLLADRAALEKSVSEATAARSSDVAKLNTQQTEFRNTWDAGMKNRDDLINSMRAQKADADKNLEAEKQAHAGDNLKFTKEANLLSARISAQADKQKLVNPPQAADGEVISSSPTIHAAYINLGRKDMLPVGTTFRVSSRGKTDVKAYAEVVRLDQDRAEVKISGVKDPFDPVVKGDQISNDLYSPNVRRTVVLIGRYSYPLTKPTVKLLLENLGNKVVEQVGPGVDLVIVGGDSLNEAADGFMPVIETKEYKDAQFLGVEIAPLHKVRDFLKLSE